MLVKRLLPLGFTRTAILKELNKTSEDVNLIALHLLEEERKLLEEKEQNKQKMKLKSLEVIKIRIRGRKGGREGLHGMMYLYFSLPPWAIVHSPKGKFGQI